MAEPADRLDVHALLTSRILDAFSALDLDVDEAQLSSPIDGPPRIRVAVRPGVGANLPASLPFHVRGRDVLVPVEVTTNFQNYKLH